MPTLPPGLFNNICDNLFETLLKYEPDSYHYNHILAKILCKLLHASQANTIEYVDGVPMLYDEGRNKTLSLARHPVSAGDYGNNIENRYLKIDDIPSAGTNGFLVPRPATITGLWGSSRSTSTWTLEARINGSAITLINENIVLGKGSDPNTDIDLNQGDLLQIYALGTGIDFPTGIVELAWRKV